MLTCFTIKSGVSDIWIYDVIRPVTQIYTHKNDGNSLVTNEKRESLIEKFQLYLLISALKVSVTVGLLVSESY